MMRHHRTTLLLVLLLALPAAAQEQKPGPVKPPPGPELKRIPANPPPETPPIPAEEIIERFTKKEAEMKQAHEQFNYRLTVRVVEFDETGKAAGEWQVVSEIIFKPDGTRVGRIIEQPPSTLKRMDFTMEDVQDLASLPMFILTPDQRPRYDITYQGKQPIDELNTFIFRVQPRRLERNVAQFEGLIWVDDRDFVIVKTYGRMVKEVEEDTVGLPFKMFETYRENIEGKYWFPTYSRSEDTVKSELGETKLRLTIRAGDFRPRETK